MKKLYAWLVIRAFKIHDIETKETIEFGRIRKIRNQAMVKQIAVFLALTSILLLLWDPLESTCRHASLSIL